MWSSQELLLTGFYMPVASVSLVYRYLVFEKISFVKTTRLFSQIKLKPCCICVVVSSPASLIGPVVFCSVSNYML